MAAQILGAIIGAVILLSIVSGQPTYVLGQNGLGQNGYGDQSPANFSMMSAFIFEVVFTFIFLLVILGSTSKKAMPGVAGAAIGFSLTIIHLFGIAVDGTSVNPARSIGPALLVGGVALDQLWLFIIAPLIGALLAGLLWNISIGIKATALFPSFRGLEKRKMDRPVIPYFWHRATFIYLS